MNTINRILVAFATKYGATGEIAERIGMTLSEAGLSVDVLPADQVKSLDVYQAVILGSAVYAGHWRKEAVQFLEGFEYSLTTKPVWIFSSGPTGEGDPVQLMKGWIFPEAQRPIVDRIHPRDITFFHGEIDSDKLNFAERLIIRGVKAPVGDFRDWNAITSWAARIGQTLQHEALQVY